MGYDHASIVVDDLSRKAMVELAALEIFQR
jgi:hypothetical protein